MRHSCRTFFHLVEVYADAAALTQHHQSAHFAELVCCLADKLASEIAIERISALNA